MKKEVQESVVVPVAAERAYQVWADFERFPLWMDHLVHVEKTGKRTSRWVMRHGAGTVEWTTEVTVADPGKELAWSSVDGDVVTYGRVLFREEAPGKTRITVSRFHAASRRADQAVLAQRFGDPAAKLRQDLVAFVQHLRSAEAARPRVARPLGTPARPAGTSRTPSARPLPTARPAARPTAGTGGPSPRMMTSAARRF